MNYTQILTLPADPKPYAVLGSPIRHSLSPVMQQTAFDELGIEARYYRIEVPEEKLSEAIAHLKAVGFGGWNCTVPLKMKMLELCDRRSPSAEQFGSVNTVVNESGVLTGHNTDGVGWSRALREAFGCSPADVRILVLGAGGAGRAVAIQALLEKCPHLRIANRHLGRARTLVDEVALRFSESSKTLDVVPWDELGPALREVDLVVNATAAGLDLHAAPVLSVRLLHDKLMVFDTVYGPACAKLRQEVQAVGARWCDGLGMLLHQGAAAVSLWTGQDAPLESMRQALFSASRE